MGETFLLMLCLDDSPKRCINIQFLMALAVFSEPHQITVWKHGFLTTKPRVSGSDLGRITAWNPCFLKLKVSTLKSVSKIVIFWCNCQIVNISYVNRCKNVKLNKYTEVGHFCINMQNGKKLLLARFYVQLSYLD